MERSLQRYLRHHRAAGHSTRTVWYHETTIDLFIRWIKGKGYSTAIEDLDADVVREWVEDQQARNLSPATLASRVKSLKAFTNWLAEEEYLDRDPLRKLKVPKVGDIPKDIFAPRDVDKLIAVCKRQSLTGARDIAIMLLLFSTGLRATELCNLRQSDVDWNQGLITIQRGKGKKYRVVPLGVKVERALERYLNHKERPEQENGFLFLNIQGEPLCYKALKEMLRRRGEKAGVHANPHKWRHSASIQYLRMGGRVENLRTMLGHSKLEMTLHYARIAGVDLTTAHQTTDPTKSLKTKG